MAKPDLDIFTGSEDLGTVFNEQNQINIKFWDVNIPFTDTAGRLSINAMGKTRIIILQGAHDGTNFTGATQEAKLADFISTVEGWVNFDGEQQRATYTDSFGNTYSVDAVDWTWTRSFQQPFRIIYTLIMKEGG